MTSNDPITGLLDQLAAYREQVTRLDTREAEHHAALSGQLAELTDQAAGIGRTLQDYAAALTQLTAASQADAEPDGYCPGPAPAWWKLSADSRHEPVARLRAWVEQVYRPGYGHLAATLGPCWDQHDLCLYGLDILAELWSVLYLQPGRSPAPGVRPGRIPSPHPARPGRPAPHRDQPLRPPPQPRTGRRPALEQAMTGATLRQALAYAARGWPVFPCQAGQKTPATAHGYRDATTDPEQITAWFTRNPHQNLAIATGAPGPDVLDVDDHGPAGNGYAAFATAQPRRAAGRRGRVRAHPQRRAARLLHAARPSATATCPPITSTSAPTAATSWPRRPRSTASPTSSSGR